MAPPKPLGGGVSPLPKRATSIAVILEQANTNYPKALEAPKAPPNVIFCAAHLMCLPLPSPKHLEVYTKINHHHHSSERHHWVIASALLLSILGIIIRIRNMTLKNEAALSAAIRELDKERCIRMQNEDALVTTYEYFTTKLRNTKMVMDGLTLDLTVTKLRCEEKENANTSLMLAVCVAMFVAQSNHNGGNRRTHWSLDRECKWRRTENTIMV